MLGGVPLYLRQFEDHQPLLENVQRRILTLGTFLYDEPRFLLLQELGEPHRYFSLLEAVASGRTRQNEIAQAAGLAATSVPFYLDTLRALGLVEREVPATETQPHKSKRGVYRLLDHFFRFWFRFVYPNHSLLERGESRPVRNQVSEQLDSFTSLAFERIARDYLWRLHRQGALGFMPKTIGSWWDDQDEIDVVSLNDAQLIAGECKWTSRPVGTNVLDELQRKTQRLLRRTASRHARYALFARSGFTPALKQRAVGEGVLLVGLADMVGAVGQTHSP